MTTPIAHPVPGARMQLRLARRRRRRQLLALVLAGLVLLTAALTIVLARDTPEPPEGLPPLRTQRTLLLQLQAPNGQAEATALLAEDSVAGAASVLLVPSQTLVPVPGVGSLTVARALPSVPPGGSRAALSTALGVTVDAGWVLDRPNFVQLVDALGGISVDVDEPVVKGRQLVLQPGSQRVDGARALAFVTHLGPGEQEQVRLARLQEVLDGVLTALPDAAPDVVPLLEGLGKRSIASLPLEALAELLVGLEKADRGSSLRYELLPVTPVETSGGNAAPTFTVDADATRLVVDRLLVGSVPAGIRDERRVLVLDGAGRPGVGEQVRDRVVPEGLVYIGSRAASRSGYARTQVLVQDGTQEAQALGGRVAQVLGLGADAVRTSDQVASVADVVVLVGGDFAPPSPGGGR